MNFLSNKNIGNWLATLNGKTVAKIYQVDFNKERHDDIYSPWLFFITFSDFDHFLEIEGDFDGDHIRINLYNHTQLDTKIKKNHLPDEPDCWSVYETTHNEIIGKLLGQSINSIEYGIDKNDHTINGIKSEGAKDIFTFIRFNCKTLHLTIFESLGLGVSDDKNIKLCFEETFDKYITK